jgi:indole-3-glycerol phosphate synthase
MGQVTRASGPQRYRYDSCMATTYLDAIVAAHRARASVDRRTWQARVDALQYDGPSFRAALVSSLNPHVKVIAEIKRRSPSKGWIDEHLDPVSLALAYQEGGANAISVLTDEQFFAGSARDLENVRAATSLPLLRKDFIVCENDVLDAVEMGASAVLLIVAALDADELRRYFDLATRCNLDVLVEVHDDDEARQAVQLGAGIVGVNQRDLHSFEVDPERAAKVSQSLQGVIKVAESGLTTPEDVARASESGFDAVLVGETFVRAADPSGAVRDFASVLRVVNG